MTCTMGLPFFGGGDTDSRNHRHMGIPLIDFGEISGNKPFFA